MLGAKILTGACQNSQKCKAINFGPKCMLLNYEDTVLGEMTSENMNRIMQVQCQRFDRCLSE